MTRILFPKQEYVLTKRYLAKSYLLELLSKYKTLHPKFNLISKNTFEYAKFTL